MGAALTSARPRRGRAAELLVTTLVLLALSAEGHAQRTLADLPAVVVDAWTGKVLGVEPPSRPSDAAAGNSRAGGGLAVSTSMCFDNATLTGLSAAPPPGVEIVDWGVKGCQGTGFVTRLAIGYSTDALDPTAGGPGATFAFALYEGTQGFGVLGIERARFDLTGLPGTTTPGQRIEYALFLDFGNRPLTLTDGNVGCGFHAQDGDTGPLLSAAPDPALGTQDLLDLYVPAPANPAAYVTTAPPFPGAGTGSIALQIEELDPDPQASAVVDNGSGINPLVFTQLQPARLGSTWLGEIDLSGFPGASVTAIGVSEGPYTPIQTAFGELLTNVAFPGFFIDLGFGLHGQFVVPRVDLIGRRFQAQGVVLLSPSGFAFTNALVVTTGF